MSSATLPRPRFQYLLDLLMLYASKSGAIVVGVFVLPWYQQLLGPTAFGIAALVLSLQAFLVMLDLGTSTLVGRDLASVESPRSAIYTLRAAQLVLHIAYMVLFAAALVIGVLDLTGATLLQLAASVVFFWALSVQNVGQSALLARKQYRVAGAIQAIGVLARAAITLAALTLGNADLDTFLTTQAATAVLQMLATSWLCGRILTTEPVRFDIRSLLPAARTLAHRGKPLVLFGLAGAAVLQLDKVIVSAFMSPAALAPYFLASMLCLTPISVLAGPITQYFQPRIFKSISSGTAKDAERQLRLLTTAIVCAVAIPSTLLWLGRDFVVHAWLNDQHNAADVAYYVSILLPGVALGALGYIPHTILTAHQDFAVQAGLSAIMTALTLMAATAFAVMGSLEGVCWVYTAYHALSTVLSWTRATQLQPCAPQNYATRSAVHALVMLMPLAAICTLLAFTTTFFSRFPGT